KIGGINTRWRAAARARRLPRAMDRAAEELGEERPQGETRDQRVTAALAVTLLGAAVVLGSLALPAIRVTDPRIALANEWGYAAGFGPMLAFVAVTAPALAFSRWKRGDVPWWAIVVLGLVGDGLALLSMQSVRAMTLDDMEWRGPRIWIERPFDVG